MQNRLVESFILFESIVNSKWFSQSSMILFLNKTDIFEVKIKNTPLKEYLSDYEGMIMIDHIFVLFIVCTYII